MGYFICFKRKCLFTFYRTIIFNIKVNYHNFYPYICSKIANIGINVDI